MSAGMEFAAGVLDGIEQARQAGSPPIVVLDLDLTLFDNRERTRAILRDFLLSSDMEPRTRAAAIERLEAHSIVYSIQENMEAIGVSNEMFRGGGLDFWMERFFSDRYCVFDTPYPGAPEACQRLRKEDASLVYLTGRYADTQAVGTVQSLRHYGFPIAELGAQLVMKTSRQESDTAYKRRVSEELLQMGTPVAAVDNEPGHCNTMKSLFPAAQVALFDSLHSPQAPDLESGIAVFDSWLPFTL